MSEVPKIISQNIWNLHEIPILLTGGNLAHRMDSKGLNRILHTGLLRIHTVMGQIRGIGGPLTPEVIRVEGAPALNKKGPGGGGGPK